MPQQITIQQGEAENILIAIAEGEPAARKRRRPSRLRTAILVGVLILLLGIMFGFTTNFIPSNSMEPTLNPGDHILTMHKWLAYPFGSEPQHGDIVVFKLLTSRVANADKAIGVAPDVNSNDPKVQVLIKRVIATGGDKVRISGNKVFVNDIELHENHAVTPVDDIDTAVYVYADDTDYKVQRGQLFVLGDNRNTSEDSRFWGPLDTRDVLGRFVRVLYNEGQNGPNKNRDPENNAQQ